LRSSPQALPDPRATDLTDPFGTRTGGSPLFERFTEGAQRAIFHAQFEARRLNHPWIGTEHILLGLVREQEGIAAKALEPLNISLEAVRQQIEEIIGRGVGDVPLTAGHIPLNGAGREVP
jgi:ATP-dependent Clp protease ATP-binding subunit ClpC